MRVQLPTVFGVKRKIGDDSIVSTIVKPADSAPPASGETREVVVRRAQAVRTVVVALSWILPMLIFWYEAWDASRPLVPLAYLACASLSLVAAFFPDSYFRPKAFELRGKLYDAMGVRLFRRFMMDGDYMNRRLRRTVPGYRFIAGRDSMRRFEALTRANERGHLMWLLAGLPPTVYAVASGWPKFAAYFVIVNILLNVYPILLQRYTRARISRILREAPELPVD